MPTWPEAHYANLQDAEVGDLQAGFPEQRGAGRTHTPIAGPGTAIAVASIEWLVVELESAAYLSPREANCI
jgi:hypothetical protein